MKPDPLRDARDLLVLAWAILRTRRRLAVHGVQLARPAAKQLEKLGGALKAAGEGAEQAKTGDDRQRAIAEVARLGKILDASIAKWAPWESLGARWRSSSPAWRPTGRGGQASRRAAGDFGRVANVVTTAGLVVSWRAARWRGAPDHARELDALTQSSRPPRRRAAALTAASVRCQGAQATWSRDRRTG